MEYRYEKDIIGDVKVESGKFWGAQTQRALENFDIGAERVPDEVIRALAYVKQACAYANAKLRPERMTQEKAGIISQVCSEIISGAHADQFPLKIWQSGSGTHANMNMNEVVANISNERLNKKLVHPIDDVNLSQSSNDVFASAVRVAASFALTDRLFPALKRMSSSLASLSARGAKVVKIGRTHLQDASPMRFSDEVGAWKGAVEHASDCVSRFLGDLCVLPLGGTEVGTGINAPAHFGDEATSILSSLTQRRFEPDPNKFRGLAFCVAPVAAHGALSALASVLKKIAHDIKLLCGGPRCGLGELRVPANEPGSSIAPGKFNPTQCEALEMASVQVMANDVALRMCSAGGDLQLNTFMPLIAHDFLQSVRLLSDGMARFAEKCLDGLEIDAEKMTDGAMRGLAATAPLNDAIGYSRTENALREAEKTGSTLKDACVRLGYATEREFDAIVEALAARLAE